MFRGLISDAKSAAGSLIAKYLARASVVVPFVIALAFATAAITLTLIDRFGSIAAFWMLAGGFIVIGLVATAVVTVKEQGEELAGKQIATQDAARAATGAAAQFAMQGLLALLGMLLSTPPRTATLAAGAKMLVRNIPLLVLLALLALLFWPNPPEGDAEADTGVAKPNGKRPPAGHGA
jgi:uncharacterized membrane protein